MRADECSMAFVRPKKPAQRFGLVRPGGVLEIVVCLKLMGLRCARPEPLLGGRKEFAGRGGGGGYGGLSDLLDPGQGIQLGGCRVGRISMPPQA